MSFGFGALAVSKEVSLAKGVDGVTPREAPVALTETPSTEIDTASVSSPAPGAGTGPDVGSVLRTAFRATVDEKVPDEMLDLLRRLS